MLVGVLIFVFGIDGVVLYMVVISCLYVYLIEKV